MPQYELMYILASTVGDDQVAGIASEVQATITTLGGQVESEQQLGKKKLAYPIKKTRNGHYIVVRFSAPTSSIAGLESKIRTQASSIIRFIIVNLEEHLRRLAKDVVVQSKLPKRDIPEDQATTLSGEDLDQKIEAALVEDVTK